MRWGLARPSLRATSWRLFGLKFDQTALVANQGAQGSDFDDITFCPAPDLAAEARTRAPKGRTLCFSGEDLAVEPILDIPTRCGASHREVEHRLRAISARVFGCFGGQIKSQ